LKSTFWALRNGIEHNCPPPTFILPLRIPTPHSELTRTQQKTVRSMKGRSDTFFLTVSLKNNGRGNSIRKRRKTSRETFDKDGSSRTFGQFNCKQQLFLTKTCSRRNFAKLRKGFSILARGSKTTEMHTSFLFTRNIQHNTNNKTVF
jgi:hypothetical protein